MIVNPFIFTSTGGPLAFDDFSAYTNGSTLAGQGNWVAKGGTITCLTPDSIYTTDAAVISACAYTGVTTPANMRAELTIPILGGNRIGVAVRIQPGASTYYGLFVWTNSLILIDVVAGVFNSIILLMNGTFTAFASGDRIALEASGAGAATRLSIQKYTSGTWSNVDTNRDPGVYYDGGDAGVCAVSTLSTDTTGTDWELWAA